MPSAAEVAANKARQNAEGAAREKAAIGRGDPQPTPAGTVVDHVRVEAHPDATAGLEDSTPAPRTDTTEPAIKTPVGRTPGDLKRADMISRYKTERQAETEADADNRDSINKLTRNGLPPEIADASMDADAAADAEEIARYAAEQAGQVQIPEGEQPAEPPLEPEPLEPETVTLKVHGRDVKMTLEEAIAKAQIALASEDLLAEAKQANREARDLLNQARGTSAPAGADQPGARTTPQPEPEPVDQGPDLKAVIEAMRYDETPDKAAEMLQQILDSAAAKARSATAGATKEQIRQEKIDEELARSQRALAAFVKENKSTLEHAQFGEDLQAVVDRRIYKEMHSDLTAHGITDQAILEAYGVPDAARAVEAGQGPTPKQIADYHKVVRATNPEAVRSMERIFRDTHTKALEANPAWRAAAAPNTQPSQRRAPAVQIDRNGRRSTIPQQPARTSAPPVPAPRAAAQPDRSAVVANIIATRGKPRGRVVGV
jgi:hypothetical protein